MSLLWHLGKGSQGPVDLGFEPTEAERRPYAIHRSGKWYTNENIDQMLMERHLNKKESVQKMMMYALRSPLKN